MAKRRAGQARKPDEAPAIVPPAAGPPARTALAALIALVGGVYFYTLAPSVMGGDAGELVASVWRLNVAHPPGYPLYHLLGRLFCALPFGSVAWRMNLFSAACGLGTAALCFAAVQRA